MLYITALISFFIVHIIPFNSQLRNRIITYIGSEKRYKLIYRLIILCIFVLGISAWNDFPNIYFYEPPVFMKQIHLAIMLPVVYLWIAAELPNNLKRYIKHPMLTGMKLWALGHLLANGDLRSMILFISFMVFSIIAVVLSNKRTEQKEHKPSPVRDDVKVILISLLVYSTIAIFHGKLFGMPVTPYFTI
jgi:uncharacterized membrane protein